MTPAPTRAPEHAIRLLRQQRIPTPDNRQHHGLLSRRLLRPWRAGGQTAETEPVPVKADAHG